MLGVVMLIVKIMTLSITITMNYDMLGVFILNVVILNVVKLDISIMTFIIRTLSITITHLA